MQVVMQPSSVKKKDINDIAEIALRRASVVSLLLASAKAVAFFYTGSLLLLASFFDSVSDSTISYFNSWIQRISRTAPDREHPFGHGGFQVISSLVQGLVIGGFAVFLIIESTFRLFGTTPIPQLAYEHLPVGISVLIVSALAGLGLSRYLYVKLRALERIYSRSLSLLADRAHYNGDAWMNLASAIGLAAVWKTGIEQLDALFGLVGAYFLVRSAVPILKQTYRDIVHTEASPDLQKQIAALAKESDPRIQSVHRMRTRELGPNLFVDFHMTLPSDLSLEAAHNIGEAATRAIRKDIPRADVMIHLDPDTEPDDDFWEPHAEPVSVT